MKTIGIITPVYNRAYCINQLYESLLRQDTDDFKWIVVDDGSSDNLKEIIDAYIAEGKIEIDYIYQNNQGMSGALNTGYANCDCELNTVIDSDDWVVENVIFKIIQKWKKVKHNGLAGMIGLNQDIKGNIIGTKLPKNITETTTSDLYGKFKAQGDKKLVYRSDLTKLFPYPILNGDKFYPSSFKYKIYDLGYKMYLFDEIISIVDCNENSMTNNKIEQYLKYPTSFAHFRNFEMGFKLGFKENVRNAVHYIAESKLAKNKRYFKDANNKFIVFLCFPLGIMLYYYIKKTKRKKL